MDYIDNGIDICELKIINVDKFYNYGFFSGDELEDRLDVTMDYMDESNGFAPDLNKAPQCLGSDDDQMDISEDLSQSLEQMSFDGKSKEDCVYMTGMGQNECKLHILQIYFKISNIDAEELSTDEESSLMMDEDGIDFYEYDGDSDNYKKAKDQAERT